MVYKFKIFKIGKNMRVMFVKKREVKHDVLYLK